MEGSEVGGWLAVPAIVIENAQLSRVASDKKQPINQAEFCARENRGERAIGEGNAPYSVSVEICRRLRCRAKRSNYERSIVFHTDLANGSPLFAIERTRHPDNHVLILGRMKVNPAKGIGGLRAAR